MIDHFRAFWDSETSDSIQKCIDRSNLAVDERYEVVINGILKENAHNATERVAAFDRVMEAVRETGWEFANAIRELKSGDFVFGFHPHPEHSIGHLHMHVLPASSKFRTYSTKAHDSKTIPADVVVEVINEELDGAHADDTY
jgi:Scavenger mRNA decapping enzyme C-term binding